jgi:hypothetical protein
MIQKTQKISLILLWLFLAILYVIQIDTRLSVNSNKKLIKQNRDSTVHEHQNILSNQDTIKLLLKKM